MKKTKTFFLTIALLWGLIASAEENSIPENVDCFNYYQFGSVQLDFVPDKITYQAGEKINFKITAQNKNSYPVVNGGIYAKIYRKNTNPNHHVINDDLMEAVYLERNLSLDSGAQKDFQYTWETDQTFPEGEYQIRGFFNVADQYNLAGLPFYDINYSGAGDFEIKNSQKHNVYLNKDAVTVDGEKFNFNAYPPRIDAQAEAAKISFELVNPDKTAKEVQLTYNLFSWDTVNQKNLIKAETKTVSLAAGAKQAINYEFSNKEHSVYDLQIIAQAKGEKAKSIIEIRVSAEGGAKEARINFPAITKFPLKKGEAADLFTCYHATGAFLVEDGKIIVDLLDGKNEIIKTIEYAKPISGEMSGLKTGFTAPQDLEKAKIRARYYQGGKLINETEMDYDCQKINPDKCAKKEMTNILSQDNSIGKYFTVFIALTFISLTIIFIWKAINKLKQAKQ